MSLILNKDMNKTVKYQNNEGLMSNIVRQLVTLGLRAQETAHA